MSRAVEPVVLSLGSNDGRRRSLLADMESMVCGILRGVVRFSPLMQTEAVDVCEGGPAFLNRLAAGAYEGSARELLADCLKVEQALGRQRPYRGAARTADVDILLFGDVRVCQRDLCIPHPAIRSRRFCLEGLAVLVPGVVPPGWGMSVREALRCMAPDVAAQGVVFAGIKG